MSQEPWPCNSRDSHPKAVPWVLGKPFYVVSGPQAESELRMDHIAGPLHILLAEKEKRIRFNIICLKLYQFKKITWWCLSILESVLAFALQSILKSIMMGKIFKKFMVSRNLGLSGRPWNLIHSPPCRTPCKLFIHEVLFGPLGLHLGVRSELGRSSPFRPMRALRVQWSRAFSLVCEVALKSTPVWRDSSRLACLEAWHAHSSKVCLGAHQMVALATSASRWNSQLLCPQWQQPPPICWSGRLHTTLPVALPSLALREICVGE
jgi:hypothetical protein